MLRTTKLMKDKYEKIQKYLFSLIPEKWEEIYLYSSIYEDKKGNKTGELYFYYLPKGILRKKPVNVYEVPQKFNINEDEYLKVVKELYDCIKELRQDFVNTEQEIWSSLTITIANYKFRVEYNYDDFPKGEDERNARRIIWRYKYLGIGGEKKEERKVLDDFFNNKYKTKRRKEIYEIGLYLKTSNNEISFDKDKTEEVPKYEKEVKNKKVINEEYQKAKENNLRHKETVRHSYNKDVNKTQEENITKKKSNKNQILNM